MYVLVCGTYVDLTRERNAVYRAISLLGQFVAEPLPSSVVVIEQVDVLVVIVGSLYGTVIPGEDISFTQGEYEEAFRLGKPCLVYLRDENTPIDPRFVEHRPEGVRALEKFKKILKSRHVTSTFKGPDDLALQVARDLTSLLQSAQPSGAGIGEGVPYEIKLTGYEDGPVRVEDYANLLRDLVFLHDHLWIAASRQTRDYDLSAGYFYTRYGRPVPDNQQLVLGHAKIGSPFDLQILIPSATLLASVAVTYYQLVQAYRTRKLLPGELRRQALDEQKLHRELDASPPKVNAEGQDLDPESREGQHSLEGLLKDLPGFVGDRKESITRVVRRDLDRISGNPIKITEVVVVRTVKPER